MQASSKLFVFLCIGLLSLTFYGCSSSLKWVQEDTSTSPSCIPDRLPVLEDFSLKTWEQYLEEDRPRSFGGQIKMEYLINNNPPYLVVKIDPSESWISPTLTNPANSIPAFELNRVLVHAQIHYMIHCMLVREGNKELQSGGNPQDMLSLVGPVAERMSKNYDQDTDYAKKKKVESRWLLLSASSLKISHYKGYRKL